ncbi:hypothetical protein BDZ91DRAFT_708862 [Kalaharituber pfeilii]|nr:hypothetical protein BDZ91DRAFT_708862 [Kalaharituber pfeilii]
MELSWKTLLSSKWDSNRHPQSCAPSMVSCNRRHELRKLDSLPSPRAGASAGGPAAYATRWSM